VKIAVIIAHPDYVATRIGGTLLKHVQGGDEVEVLILCPGDLGPGTILYPEKPTQDIVDLWMEQLADLSKTSGFKDIRVRRYPDTKIDNNPELRLDIASWLREVRPAILITHWPRDAHPDVRQAGQAALDACLISVLSPVKTDHPAHEVAKVYAFPIRTSIDFVPDVIVDVSDVIERKLAGVKCLDMVARELQALSATPDDPNGWHEKILGPDLYWGQLGGVRYGEPFRLSQQPEGRRAVSRLAL
jgi:LmbE family N-acetylglucosaminyl deacetylase